MIFTFAGYKYIMNHITIKHMKTLLLSIGTLATALALGACSNTSTEQAMSQPENSGLPLIQPDQVTELDISPERLAREAEDRQRYLSLDSIVQQQGPMALGADDLNFYNQKSETMEEGYYSTIMGCSWYCAGQILEIRGSESSGLRSMVGETPIHDFDASTAQLFDLEHEPEVSYTLGTSPTLTVTKLDIYNGFSKDSDLYHRYARARHIKYFVDGEPRGILELKDVPGLQSFPIKELRNPEKVMTLTFQILDSYPGTEFKEVAISEIELDGEGHH